MRALVKGIIIAIITVGIVVPAGYYSLVVYHPSSISIAQLVPENSTMVIRGDYNGTPVYAYNYSNTEGVVVGISMSNFDAQIAANSNVTNGTHTQIQPSLYKTYRGYSIYEIKNVSLSGIIPGNISSVALDYNLSSNLSKYISNSTIYLVEVSSIVSLGSVQAVEYSIDALSDKVTFQAQATEYFNTTSNVSLYFRSTDTPVHVAIVNVFYLSTQMNIEMNNASNTKNLTAALSYLSGYTSSNYGYTFFYPSSTSTGNWVNGTISVGIGNYARIQQLVNDLPTGLNLTQYISGFSA